MGEDLSAGIALQWAARRTSDLRPEATIPNPVRAREMLRRYSDIGLPALVLLFSDDSFATEAGTRRLLASYPTLHGTLHVINPATVGMAKIGHFGFFRRAAETRLWPVAFDYMACIS